MGDDIRLLQRFFGWLSWLNAVHLFQIWHVVTGFPDEMGKWGLL
jgi:hypothetical protein